MSLKKDRIVNQVLTHLARGYKNAQMVGDILFPVVSVDKLGITVPVFGKEAFKIYSTLRAPRADSNIIQPLSAGSLDVVLKEHDLVYPVDWLEKADAMFDKTARAANIVTDALLLSLEKERADMAQNPDNYAVTNKVVLSGASCFTTEADPIGMIKECKEAVRRQIGVMPNTMVLGAQAFNTLTEHPQLQDRVKYVMKGVINEDLLQEILDIKTAAVGRAVYEASSGSMSDVWGDNIILAYVPENEGARSEEEPSYGYTFRHGTDGLVVDEYLSNGGKINNIRCTDVRRPALVGASAGYLIANVTE
jgi:hypothetical protein